MNDVSYSRLKQQLLVLSHINKLKTILFHKLDLSMPMIAAHETFKSFIFICVWNFLNLFDELITNKHILNIANSILWTREFLSIQE